MPGCSTRSSCVPARTGYADAIADNGSREYARTDVDAAIALLAEAGVVSPRVCILYDPSNPRRVAEFRLIAKSAARAGFVVADCSNPDWEGLLGVAGRLRRGAVRVGHHAPRPGRGERRLPERLEARELQRATAIPRSTG